jgi:hypothetical protein
VSGQTLRDQLLAGGNDPDAYNRVHEALRTIYKEDQAGCEHLRDCLAEIASKLDSLGPGFAEGVRRVRAALENAATSKDQPGRVRNEIGKACNALGLKTPILF